MTESMEGLLSTSATGLQVEVNLTVTLTCVNAVSSDAGVVLGKKLSACAMTTFNHS